jgi:hypothetical protein
MANTYIDISPGMRVYIVVVNLQICQWHLPFLLPWTNAKKAAKAAAAITITIKTVTIIHVLLQAQGLLFLAATISFPSNLAFLGAGKRQFLLSGTDNKMLS